MARQLRRLGMSKTVEVPILVNTKTTFQFSDSIILLDKVLIHGFYVRAGGDKTSGFRQCLPLGNIMSSFLNLYGYNQQQFNYQFPLNLFKTEDFWGTIRFTMEPIFLKPKLVSIRNSSLFIPGAGALVIPPDGFGLDICFFYELYDPEKHKLNEWGELLNDVNEP